MKTRSERDSNGTPEACKALQRREKERRRVMEEEMANGGWVGVEGGAGGGGREGWEQQKYSMGKIGGNIFFGMWVYLHLPAKWLGGRKPLGWGAGPYGDGAGWPEPIYTR